MCCASLLETVRELCRALLALSRTGVFARGAGALVLSLGRAKLYRSRLNENRRADCEIAARAGVSRLRPECLSAIPQGPHTRRPRRTVSSGSIPVALCVGDRLSAGGWRRAAADQSLCSAGADDSWAGNRKHFALSSAAQSRRHRGRADRGGVLVFVVLPLSPVLFQGLYRKPFVCVWTANVADWPAVRSRFARTSGAEARVVRVVWHELTRALPDLANECFVILQAENHCRLCVRVHGTHKLFGFPAPFPVLHLPPPCLIGLF